MSGSERFDLILRGGFVHDGSGDRPRQADVAIVRDRIAAVGSFAGADARESIDVTGLHVAPGFADMHSHSDTELIAAPVNAAKTRQGITLDVIGQDGLGVAPFDRTSDEDWRRSLLPLTGHPDLPWTWGSFGEHLAAIESAGPATNVAALIGFATVRHAVVGLADRAPTAAEADRMDALIGEAMVAGAFGMSVGLVYPPAVFATTDELVRAYSVVGRHGGLMVIHLRSQGVAWLEAIDEAVSIAQRAEVALHISHLCCLGRAHWAAIPVALERLERARATGLAVTFDQHPYTAASTTLSQILPPWAIEGGAARMCERLGDRATRDRIRTEIAGPGRLGWENYAGLAGWDSVQIAGVSAEANRIFLGRSIGEVARERGAEPFDTAADLLVSERGSVPMVLLGTFDDEGILAIMRSPGGSIGTDGVIAEHPHPRLFGTTARVLGHDVRELGGLSLEAAVLRLGPAGAAILGLPERGSVRAGSFADLVVFDPATITDRATYMEPRQHPDGISHVLVNGQFAVRDGRETGVRAGRVIRRGLA